MKVFPLSSVSTTNLTCSSPNDSLLIDSDALLFTVLSATQHEQMVNDEGDTILASDILEARESYWYQVNTWQNQFRVRERRDVSLVLGQERGVSRSIRSTRPAVNKRESRSATRLCGERSLGAERLLLLPDRG